MGRTEEIEAAVEQFVAAGAERATITIVPDCDRPDDMPCLHGEVEGVRKEWRPNGQIVDIE